MIFELSKSKVFLFLCISFIVGVFVESFVEIPLRFIGGIFIFGIIFAAIFWVKNKKAVVAGFCLMVAALGAFRCLEKEQSGSLSRLNNKGRLAIVGLINDLPDRRQASQKLIIKAQQATIGGRIIKVSGLTLVTTKLYPQYQYGDTIEILGQLNEPNNFQDFDYRSYLAKSNIYSVMDFPDIKVLKTGQGNKLKSGLFWLKNKFESVLAKTLPEPQASFMAGLTLGEKKTMPKSLTEAFKKTGTTHIVALSGYNISLIASFFMIFFSWLMVRRSLRFWLAVLAIIFFTILTGASASVVRAAIMGILVLLAQQEGRLYSIRNALVFAGAAMIYLNPKILRFDIGFQLSFLATAGLVWLAPVFSLWLEKWPKALGLKEILIATLSAQLAVMPILLIYFGQLSIISPLVNLIILLLIPQTMLLGFAAGISGMIWLLPAKIFSWLAWLYLTIELRIIEFFASWPLASIKMEWDWPGAIIYYLIIICLLYLLNNKKKQKILVEQWAEE